MNSTNIWASIPQKCGMAYCVYWSLCLNGYFKKSYIQDIFIPVPVKAKQEGKKGLMFLFEIPKQYQSA